MQSAMNDNEIYDKRYTDNYVCVLKSALSICFVYLIVQITHFHF